MGNDTVEAAPPRPRQAICGLSSARRRGIFTAREIAKFVRNKILYIFTVIHYDRSQLPNTVYKTSLTRKGYIMDRLQKWFEILAGVDSEEISRIERARMIFDGNEIDLSALALPAYWRRRPRCRK